MGRSDSARSTARRKAALRGGVHRVRLTEDVDLALRLAGHDIGVGGNVADLIHLEDRALAAGGGIDADHVRMQAAENLAAVAEAGS